MKVQTLRSHTTILISNLNLSPLSELRIDRKYHPRENPTPERVRPRDLRFAGRSSHVPWTPRVNGRHYFCDAPRRVLSLLLLFRSTPLTNDRINNDDNYYYYYYHRSRRTWVCATLRNSRASRTSAKTIEFRAALSRSPFAVPVLKRTRTTRICGVRPRQTVVKNKTPTEEFGAITTDRVSLVFLRNSCFHAIWRTTLRFI